MDAPNQDKAEFFRNFADGLQIREKSLSDARSLYGYDEIMHTERQIQLSSVIAQSLLEDEGVAAFNKAAYLSSVCPVCTLGFRYRLDMVEHCYRNKDTVFHEVF